MGISINTNPKRYLLWQKHHKTYWSIHNIPYTKDMVLHRKYKMAAAAMLNCNQVVMCIEYDIVLHLHAKFGSNISNRS